MQRLLNPFEELALSLGRCPVLGGVPMVAAETAQPHLVTTAVDQAVIMIVSASEVVVRVEVTRQPDRVRTDGQPVVAVTMTVGPVQAVAVAVLVSAPAVEVGVMPVGRVRVPTEPVRPRDRGRSEREQGSSQQGCHPNTRAETRENGQSSPH